MPYRPIYKGLAKSPDYQTTDYDDAPTTTSSDDVVLVAAMIVVVGVVFLYVARQVLAERVQIGPVLRVHPDTKADQSQISNIISTIRAISPQE